MPKTKKKTPKRVSTACKCEQCKRYKKPNKVERAIASLHFENPYPWHDSDTLQRLVTVNFPRLKEQAEESGLDAISMGEALHRAIRESFWYSGPDDDDAFTAFIAQILAIELDRNKLVESFEEHRLLMLKAISGVVTANKDLGADLGNPYAKRGPIWSPTVDEIYADIPILLLANPWRFLSPATCTVEGDPTATLPTRLAAFAQWQARAWKTRQLREREAGREASLDKFEAAVRAAEDELDEQFGLGGLQDGLEDLDAVFDAAFEAALVHEDEEEDESEESFEESEDFLVRVA